MFNLSPECDVALRSFLCLHLFGVCDGNSSFLATGATCSLVRDEVCEREWREIDALIDPARLPICEELPQGDTAECTGKKIARVNQLLVLKPEGLLSTDRCYPCQPEDYHGYMEYPVANLIISLVRVL